MTKVEKIKRLSALARRMKNLETRRLRLEAEVKVGLKLLPSNPALN